METLVLSQIAMTAGRRQRISDGRVLATAALLAAMAVAGAGHAAGDMDDQAETDADAGIHSDEAEADLSDGALLSDRLAHRWIPSASFFTMGGVQPRHADMAADIKVKQSDPLLNADGRSVGLPWSIGGTIDIASPVVIDAPGAPRFYSHADVGYTYDVEDPVVTRGDPGNPPVLPPGSTSSIGIQGVGGSVRVESKPLVLSGGVGTVFEFKAFDRGFRFRPTLEWIYGRDTMKNTLGGGESESVGTSCAAPTTCRTVFIKTQTEKGFHSLGPGLELEADVGRAGDFLVGFYGAFRAYYLVGDRTANQKSTGKWFRLDNGQPSTRQDTVFVTRYEREPWHYRFGFGIRILWSPEE